MPSFIRAGLLSCVIALLGLAPQASSAAKPTLEVAVTMKGGRTLTASSTGWLRASKLGKNATGGRVLTRRDLAGPDTGTITRGDQRTPTEHVLTTLYPVIDGKRAGVVVRDVKIGGLTLQKITRAAKVDGRWKVVDRSYRLESEPVPMPGGGRRETSLVFPQPSPSKYERARQLLDVGSSSTKL